MALLETLLWNSAIVLLTVASAIYLFFKYNFSYWESRGVPYLKPSFPFGTAEKLLRKKENFGMSFMNKYKELKESFGAPVGGAFMSFMPVLVVLDPAVIKTVLVKEFNKFPDRGAYFNEVHDPLSAHMFALRGQKWKTLRSKITPTFTSGKMKMMFTTLVDIGNQLDGILEDLCDKQSVVGAKDLLARFTTDIIGSCVFGIDCNSLKNPNAEFRKYGTQFINSTLSSTLQFAFGFIAPGLLKLVNFKPTDQECAKFFLNVLRETIEYRERNEIHRRDFMDMFIRLKNNESIQDESLVIDSKFQRFDNDSGITFWELAAQAFVFFIAGFEASSTTSSVAMVELARNKHVQSKLRDEMRRVIAKHNGELTYEAVGEMIYLDQVVNETLRKYPVAPIVGRKCREDCPIPNTNIVVEKGTMVWIPVLGIHRDPEYYPNPDKFDPGRFTEEEKAKRLPFTYLPFGDGPRNCIGMRFAILQTKVALITFLRDYEWDLNPKTKYPLLWSNQGILLFPKEEVWLNVSRVEK